MSHPSIRFGVAHDMQPTNQQTVELLVKAGADVNIKDNMVCASPSPLPPPPLLFRLLIVVVVVVVVVWCVVRQISDGLRAIQAAGEAGAAKMYTICKDPPTIRAVLMPVCVLVC